MKIDEAARHQVHLLQNGFCSAFITDIRSLAMPLE